MVEVEVVLVGVRLLVPRVPPVVISTKVTLPVGKGPPATDNAAEKVMAVP